MLHDIRLASEDNDAVQHNYKYTIWGIGVLRRLSYIISWIFIKLEISPNQITLISLIMGIFGWGNFSDLSVNYVSTIFKYNRHLLGAIFLNIWGILDCSDGTVARLTNSSSDFGAKFEAIVGSVVVSGLFIFVGYAEGLFVFGFMCFIFQFMTRLFFTLDFAEDIDFFKDDLNSIEDYLLLIGYNLNNATGIVGVLLIFALLGITDLFIIFYTIISPISFIVSVVKKMRMRK